MVSSDLCRNQKTNFHFEMSFVSGTINDHSFIFKKIKKISRYIQGFEKEQVKFIKTENWTSNSLSICDKEIDEQDRMGFDSRLIYLMQTIMNGLI